MSNWTSNAFNFDSYCSGGVDQRTRSYSYQILLGSLLGNWLKGPNLDISIQFSPYSSENLGFGQGWTLNLPRYDIEQKQLYLANGQSYRAELTANYQLNIRYKKLLDFTVSANTTGYQITYRNGRKDILDSKGYIKKIIQSDGHALNFLWLNIGDSKRLSKVWDDRTSQASPLLLITYPNVARINIFTNMGTIHEAYFSLILSNQELVQCHLPEDVGSYDFVYQSIGSFNLIKNVTHPCGLEEQLIYVADGIRVDANSYLPAVTQHNVLTRNSPVITTQYDSVGGDDHNFMGFGVSGGSLSEGIDNLLERGVAYTYQISKIENGEIETKQTYNQFHLLIEEERIVNRQTVHCKKLGYPALDNTSFADQPAQYALIDTEQQTWQMDNDSHTQVRFWIYDKYGNMLLFTDENNITEQYQYYAPDGETGCPASPSGMANFVKSRMLTNGTDTRQISYQYTTIAGTNQHDNVVLIFEDAHQRYQSHYHYHTESDQIHSLGRLASIKNDILHPNGRYSTTTNYQYVLNSETIEEHQQLICHDDNQTNLVVGYYLYIGELSHHIDADGIRSSIQYDSLRRITQESIEGSASRSYQYTIDTGDARQIMVLTDCKGNQCEQSWDGQGRELNAKIDNTLVWQKEYDELGRLKSKSTFDTLPDINDRTISVTQTETYQYDDWGQVKATVLANGCRQIEFNNLASRQKTQGIEGLELTVSTLNNWGLEEHKQQGSQSWRYQYDKWGRLEQETNPLNQSTHYSYDHFDRVINIKQANQVSQQITYAAHTDQSQVAKVKIGEQLVGWRDVDGLGRPLSLYRGSSPLPSLEWTYSDSSNIPEFESSLSSPLRTFTRDTQLGELSSKACGGQSSEYRYDKISGLPTESFDNAGSKSSITYSPTGLPETEINNNNIRQYTYSPGGVISSIQTDDEHRQYRYDELGRLVKLSTDAATLSYQYDQFDRIIVEQLVSAGQTQITEIDWDNYSREINRAVALNDHYIFEQSQTYNDLGLVASRSKTCATFGEVTENYTYDELNQLTKVTFLGNGPISDWSQPLTCIEWDYDLLGNMQTQRCQTAEAQDLATFYYESDDPCQLTRISHTHPTLAQSIDIHYDANGNMIQDAEGRLLEYDNFDRLANVNTNGIDWGYEYDSNDRLVHQRSSNESRDFEYLWNDLCSIKHNGHVTNYVYHDGLPKWSQQGSAVSLLATDQNGSVVADNAPGQTGAVYRYSPFGQRDQAENNNEA